MTEKDQAVHRVEAYRELLLNISDYIFQHPEMGFQEYKAAAYLSNIMETHGFRVTRNIADLPTSFHASCGAGKPRIGLLVEYDAVSPALGHACGHHLIAASSTIASIILSEVAGKTGGTIEVFGTPAEEEGGGKIYMAESGAFDGMDAVFYIHPSYNTRIGGRSLATRIVEIEAEGRAAHSARAPYAGHNATNALIHIFQMIDSLRQQFPEGVKTNGVIQEGGQYPSSINDYAKGRVQVFSKHPEDVEAVTRTIERIAEGIGIATSTTCRTKAGPVYAPRVPNLPLAQAMENNMRKLGLDVESMPEQEQGYTDVGNVSEVAPTVQGYITLNAGRISNHTPEFARIAGGEKGREAMLNATRILVMTGVDLLMNPSLTAQVHSYFGRR